MLASVFDCLGWIYDNAAIYVRGNKMAGNKATKFFKCQQHQQHCGNHLIFCINRDHFIFCIKPKMIDCPFACFFIHMEIVAAESILWTPHSHHLNSHRFRKKSWLLLFWLQYTAILPFYVSGNKMPRNEATKFFE